jgi:hypothetical protein
MSHWNYRIVDLSEYGYKTMEPWFEVQEVFYNDDGSIAGYSDVSVGDEHKDRIVEILQRMIDDIKRNPNVVSRGDVKGFNHEHVPF